ncbi:MAG TPA: hypothetical protein VIM11_20805 [Tepidisphaeraceae bacterium]|jgi:hypothetical protein
MVRYFDECKWADVGDGMIFQFVDGEGNIFSEIALMNSDGQLWKFEVMLPERNQVNGTNPAAIVSTQAAARRIAETILLSTIVTR